ncbi:MAG TPA: glycosyltransferase family 39 protein [Bryobacteraceae bacterium]|nr:glycosyltransferase family 39 protein [Bryobacteraceae bacterium]
MPSKPHKLAAGLLMLVMLFLAGGAALRESVTVDEVAHIGAGLSYLQRLDLRLNPEHPPLAKILAAVPLVMAGTRAEYSSGPWKASNSFLRSFIMQWDFGNYLLGRWNDWKPTLMLARAPMTALTLLLGWIVFTYGARLGGAWGGLLCLAAYVTTPAFLTFGPLVITDVPVTLFIVITLWRLGEMWTAPSRKNALLFGLALAGALLSKFTALLLFPVSLVLFLHTRMWPLAAEPKDKGERKIWRRERWRSFLVGSAFALAVVYLFYFVFSLNQPDDALDRIGSGPWASVIRRPLMPVWLYIRGILFMLSMGSRPTFVLGHEYAHGVPFYFPVVLALKSTLGFLLLLILTAVVRVVLPRGKELKPKIVPAEFQAHWRTFMVAFFFFLAVCLLSQLDISIRHFAVPIVLLVLMLAPLPCMIQKMPSPKPLLALTVVFLASSFVACFTAYPYFFPFENSLALGHPIYTLLNDSNVSWNGDLPEVDEFARQHGLSKIKLDWASISDPILVTPRVEDWDCQTPSSSDAGHWVVVTAVSILENHNCRYLRQYPSQAIAGGGMYAFHLPPTIPPPGAPNGPPLLNERKRMWGMPFDVRARSMELARNPDRLEAELQSFLHEFEQLSKKQK